MANSMNIADYVIVASNKIGKPVSNLSLQKIMYFLNVIHMLTNSKKPLIDESFERWIYGPVLSDVYSEYCENGSDSILEPTTHLTDVTDNGLVFSRFNENSISEKDRSFIDNYLKLFIKFNPFELVNKSHEEPQWKNKVQGEKYSNKESISFYSDEKNRFWENIA